jgi:hypothetical protein
MASHAAWPSQYTSSKAFRSEAVQTLGLLGLFGGHLRHYDDENLDSLLRWMGGGVVGLLTISFRHTHSGRALPHKLCKALLCFRIRTRLLGLE